MLNNQTSTVVPNIKSISRESISAELFRSGAILYSRKPAKFALPVLLLLLCIVLFPITFILLDLYTAMNRPFSSCLLSLCQNKSSCETNHQVDIVFPAKRLISDFHMKGFSRVLLLKERHIR